MTDNSSAPRTLRDIFSGIYREGAWGTAETPGDFYSGSGSHDPGVIGGYVEAVGSLIAREGGRPDVVDLGCGDFHVGSRLRGVCGRFIACDVVPEIVERNRRVFASLDVEFRCVDIVEEDLPDGEIAILRQVLQHLSNEQILRVLPKLRKFRWLVVTEHLPAGTTFNPNLDQRTGSAIRLSAGSGVVLTAAPFQFETLGEQLLHSVPQMGGRIDTIAYALRPASRTIRYASPLLTFATGRAPSGEDGRTPAGIHAPAPTPQQVLALALRHQAQGDRQRALAAFTLRATLGGASDEVFFSLCNAARLKLELGHDHGEVLATYQRASDACPSRAEALHAASFLCRQDGRNEEGYRIAQRGLGIPMPEGALGLEPWIYEYGLLDEFAVNAYWAGHYEDCAEASRRILSRTGLDPEVRARVSRNLEFALQKLGQPAPRQWPPPHALEPPRAMHARHDAPRVLVAILAKQKEPVLPLYLQCIEALDYPKSSICLYIRTNNNTDRTAAILAEWVARVGGQYAQVEMDASDIAANVQQFGVHEWNAIRFKALGRIRKESMNRALRADCAYYFVVDVDNFVRPCTLGELVALDLPVVAPLLRHVDPDRPYSNFHAAVDGDGYYVHSELYLPLLHRKILGVCEVPVVHCTYLVRADMIPLLEYVDATERHEYVVFSDGARRHGIQQYLDTRQLYGYLTLEEDADAARRLLGAEVDPARAQR